MPCPSICLLCRAALARQEGCYEDALSLLDAALRAVPAHREARLLRGQVCALAGRPRQAVEAFRGLIADDPADAEAHLNLAGVYLLLGLYGDATVHLKLTAMHSQPVEASHAAPPFSRN